MSHRRSLRRAVAGVAVAGLALSGCGVANDSLRPGLAAQVGETEIELDQVDDAAADLCDMITFLSDQGAAPTVPGSVVRDNSLKYAVLREMGEQLAGDYGVEAGDLYRGSIDASRSQLAAIGVDEDTLDIVVPTLTSGDYFLDVVQQIGQGELDLSPAQDTQQLGMAEGLRIAQEWEDEHGLEVNPRFSDMSIGDINEIVQTHPESLSVAVSDFATQALAGVDATAPDQSYAESLPDPQRCG